MISSEVQKGLQRNFRSPKEREEFAKNKRKNDHCLDLVERRNAEHHESVDRHVQDEMSVRLEREVYTQRQRGEIIGGSTKHVFSNSLPTT